MSQIQFRAAAIGDADQIARLVNAAYRPAPGEGGWTHESDLVRGDRTSPSQIEALIGTSTVIVGVIGAKAVACAHVAGEGSEAQIGMLAVEPTLQAGGVGKALLAYAEEYAFSVLGAKDLMLVVVRARLALIEFYMRRGYQRTGSLLEYPTGACVGTPIAGALELEVLRKRANNLLLGRQP